MESVRMSRAELYDAVWKTPMSRLAHEFGMSDVALAKTCRRLNIPRPTRGYWARVAAGEKLQRPPLPKGEPKQQEWIYLQRVREPATPATLRPDLPTVPVPNNLECAHHAVRHVGLALQHAEADEYGRLVVPGPREPVLAVTVEAHRRALLLLDALCKALAVRGHGVAFARQTAGDSTSGGFMLVIGADRILAAIVERLDRKDHVPRATDGNGASAPKYDYYAAGRLQLHLQVSAPRASWSDVKRRRLDQQLGHAIVAAEAEAEARRLRREAEEQRRHVEAERHRQQQEEARRLREQEARLRHEELLAKDLQQMARNWSAAQEVRAFVTAVEQAALGIEQPDDFARWLRWATSYAARLDPLTRLPEIPKPLEPDLSNLG
jgi:hypothetical protein